MRAEIPSEVLARRALVYVRQSSGAEVQENLESQRRQYALVEQARSLGFQDVVLIDQDLGRSASGLVERPGFQSLFRPQAGRPGRGAVHHRLLQPGEKTLQPGLTEPARLQKESPL